MALGFLAKHGTALLAVGILAGLGLPELAALLRPLLTVSVAAILFLAMLRLDWGAVAGYGRRPGLVLGAGAWLLVVVPVAVFLAARGLGLSAPLTTALVLMAAAPPIMSGPAFALLIGLDGALCLVVMVAATLAAPFVLPAVALQALGLELDIGAGVLAFRLALLVGGPMVASLVVRRLLGAGRLADWAVPFDGLMVLLLLVFAIAVMDGVTARLLADPGHVMTIVGVAFAANLILQAVGTVPYWGLGREVALSVGYSCGNRNMAMLLAVLPASSDPDVLLYFALGQFPIYILPGALAPLYRRLLKPR